MATINERIRILRKEKNLTLEKFGEMLGVKKSTISGIENGNRNVTEQMFTSICREYSVNPTWLRTGEGDMFTDDKEEFLFQWVGRVLKEKPDSFKKRYLNFLSSLDDEDWVALEKYFDKIKEV